MSATDAGAGARAERARRIHHLVTPEGVDLQLVIAEASERAIAFFLDIAIIALALIAISLAALAFTLSVGMEIAEFMGTIWLLGFFLLRNFYFAAFELTPRAATPGKRIIGLRVAARSGAGLTADAVIARNAMRELELFLPFSFLVAYGPAAGIWGTIAGFIWCSIFVFFPLFNRERLRIGDLVAGTIVVHTPRRALDIDLAEKGAIAEGKFVFTTVEVDVYGVKELAVLEDVLRTRDGDTMEAVAARIRTKISRTQAPGESNAAFLQAYYVAFRKRLEGRLLLGQRKRDKFDRT
jgi:uncharacterized RDD family membrane protein YckC